MARIAAPRTRTVLFVAILLPLWASYLAKVYSWLLIFTKDGVLDWTFQKLGLAPSTSDTRTGPCSSSSATSGCRS